MKARTRNGAIAKRPYPTNRKRNRHEVIYGVCVRNTGRQHYCFDRDYRVLPIELPVQAVDAIVASADGVLDEGVNCFGTERPPEIGDLSEWKTYYLFSDNTAPNWNFDT